MLSFLAVLLRALSNQRRPVVSRRRWRSEVVKESLSQRERAAEGRVRGTASKDIHLWYPLTGRCASPSPVGRGISSIAFLHNRVLSARARASEICRYGWRSEEHTSELQSPDHL